jgi:hypothetical protein
MPDLNETDLLHLFIARVPYALPGVRVFRRPIINATATAHGRTFHVRNGITGQADAYAITRGGLHVELETKAATGRLAEAQSAWRSFCQEFSIPHLVLRAERYEHPDATVERWIRELGEEVAR